MCVKAAFKNTVSLITAASTSYLVSIVLRITIYGAPAAAQQMTGLASLEDNKDSILSAHMAANNCEVQLQHPLLASAGIAPTWYTDTWRQNTPYA